MPPRPSSSLTVAPADIAPLQAFAEKAGLDFTAILNDLRLPADLTDETNSCKANLEDYFRLLARLSFAAQDETCQISVRPLIPGTTEFVFSMLSESANLFDAMKRVAKSYNLVHGGAYNRVEKRASGLVYIIDDKEFPYAADAQSGFVYSLMEGVLILLHALLSHACGADLFVSVRKIYTKRPRIDAPSPFLTFWNAPVHCNANYYALIYDLSAADIPIRIALDNAPQTAGVYDIVAKLIGERERAGARPFRMTDRVIDMLEAGIVNQDNVAQRLGVSIATLRRRLAAEGETFRDLHHRVLNERAKILLRRHRHASDVAQELGFSDFRSFSRAFKQWNGVTPTVYANSN